MHYLKNADPVVSYADPHTRQTIGRGEVVAFASLTENMKARIRKGGIIVVSKKEYDAYHGYSAPKESIPKNATPVKMKEEMADEAQPDMKPEEDMPKEMAAPKTKKKK